MELHRRTQEQTVIFRTMLGLDQELVGIGLESLVTGLRGFDVIDRVCNDDRAGQTAWSVHVCVFQWQNGQADQVAASQPTT